MLMTKQQIADTALREQIASWTRAALGPLVEEDDIVCVVAVPIAVRYSKGKRCREDPIHCVPTSGTWVRNEEWSHAYSCSRGRAAPGVSAAPCPAGRTPYRRSRARRAHRTRSCVE